MTKTHGSIFIGRQADQAPARPARNHPRTPQAASAAQGRRGAAGCGNGPSGPEQRDGPSGPERAATGGGTKAPGLKCRNDRRLRPAVPAPRRWPTTTGAPGHRSPQAMKTDATPGLNPTRQPGAKGLLGAPQQWTRAEAAQPPLRGRQQRQSPPKHPHKGCRRTDRQPHLSPRGRARCPLGPDEPHPSGRGATGPAKARVRGTHRPAEKAPFGRPHPGNRPPREAEPAGNAPFGRRDPRDGAHRERPFAPSHPPSGRRPGSGSSLGGERAKKTRRVSSETRPGLPGKHPRMRTRATGPRGVGTLQGTGKTRRTQRSRPRATSEQTGTGGPFGTFRRAGRNPAKAPRGRGQGPGQDGDSREAFGRRERN